MESRLSVFLTATVEHKHYISLSDNYSVNERNNEHYFVFLLLGNRLCHYGPNNCLGIAWTTLLCKILLRQTGRGVKTEDAFVQQKLQ